MLKRAAVAGGALAALLLVVALFGGRRVVVQETAPAPPASPPATLPPAASEAASEADQGFLYGRVTTTDGATYQGRLRLGGGEEAFWSDFFNGAKEENPWAAHVPPERLPREDRSIRIFGVVLATREFQVDLGRPFMVRFGDVARIDARRGDLRVTLKSGTVFHLDRYGADDFADGLRVWDERHGVVDLGERRMRSIELLPTPRLDDPPARLHGTVHTRQGEFSGPIQWNREDCVGSDELEGRGEEGRVALRFDTIRSIARHSAASTQVTLRDGRRLVLSGSAEAGDGHRGVLVDDPRYGRVLVSWDAFERLDLTAGDSGPAYGDFPPGRPLTGAVATRDGRRLTGRIVFDLDESETTETLDAPAGGVDYSLPFARVASISPPVGDGGGARVTLRDGGELELEASGDLGETNAGLLVFTEGSEKPAYVPWAEVGQVTLDHPPTVDLPLGGL